MVDTFALLLIVIVSLWIVGWIGVRVGYHDGYQQALADSEFYDAIGETARAQHARQHRLALRGLWPLPPLPESSERLTECEEERCDD